MPASNFLDHVVALRAVLDSALASGEAARLDLRVDQRSVTRGMIDGVIEFRDGSQLHLREFVDVEAPQERLMYAYHYQAADGSLVFRYDNAAHRPPSPLPQHKHTRDGTLLDAPLPSLREVIDEVLHLIEGRFGEGPGSLFHEGERR